MIIGITIVFSIISIITDDNNKYTTQDTLMHFVNYFLITIGEVILMMLLIIFILWLLLDLFAVWVSQLLAVLLEFITVMIIIFAILGLMFAKIKNLFILMIIINLIVIEIVFWILLYNVVVRNQS